MSHTPTPWKIIGREVMEDGSVYPEHIIGGFHEFQICLMESISTAALSAENPDKYPALDAACRANAEFIVRAVNAHDDLVAALEAIAEGCSFPEDAVQEAVCKRARAALEKLAAA